jgi:protein O-mannosyl-transferase
MNQERIPGWIQRPWVAAALLVSLTLVTYGNSLQGGFVWDDVPIVVEGVLGPSAPRLSEVLVSPDEVKPYYRPLNRASYLLDARVWGSTPLGFHVANVALHAANVVVLFLELRYLFGRTALALGAAALLAVHPVNAETVDFVSARNNLFALLFLQASVVLLAMALEGRSRRASWASGLAWFLALSSKESAAAGIVVLCAYVLFPIREGPERLRDRLPALAPHAVALAAYLGLRSVALEGVVGMALRPAGLGETLRLNYHVLPRYLGLVLYPAGLNVFHPVPPGGPLDAPGLLVAWVAIVLVLAGLLRQRSVPSMAGLAWFAACYLPIANLLPIPSAAMAERFLYLPAVGLWVIGADQALRLRERVPWKRVATMAMVAVLVALAARTVRRNADWKDDLALFQSSVQDNASTVAGWFNLGSTLRDRGDLEGAGAAWERARQVDPRDVGPLTQLATLAAVRGDLPRAEALYREVLAIDPGGAVAHLNLAKLLERTGRPAEALVHYERFLALATKGEAEHVAAARAARERLRAPAVPR